MVTRSAPASNRAIAYGPELRTHLAALQAALDGGDESAVEQQLDAISRLRESSLFAEMGRITRQLHEALVGLQLGPEIASLTEHDIPDAKVRLDYVLKKTEQAAHRTLSAVEAALPLSTGLGRQAAELGERWQDSRRSELAPAQLQQLTRELETFLVRVTQDSAAIGDRLSEVLMAQDFQDLTGQVIRRVVDVVQEVQSQLVELMRKRGAAAPAKEPSNGAGSRAEGPQVKASPAANVVQSQDDVDDLLSSLGF